MDKVIELIWSQIGGGWLAGLVVIGLVLHYSGAIPAFFQAREAARERESDEHTSYVENLARENSEMRASLDQHIRGRQDDLERWRQIWKDQAEEVARVRAAGEAKDETIVRLARGESQWRHAYRGACSSIMALRVVLDRAGVEFPAFEAWRDVMELDPKLYVELESLFNPKPKEHREQPPAG